MLGELVRPVATGVVSGVILALLAPYQTGAIFDAAERYIFWIWCSVAGALLLTAFDRVATTLGREHGVSRPLSASLGVLAAAVPITLIVHATAPAIDDGTRLLPFWSLFPSVLIICIPLQIVMLLLARTAPRQSPAPAPDPHAVTAPRSPLFDKVPARLGRDLLCLKTEDHYLRVYTTAGDALILMSMSDAEASLGRAAGQRVHRSWWVARAAVKSATTTPDAVRLNLTNGLEVPVSRSRRQSLRDQGWFQTDDEDEG
ncbi:LytTR family DNA-binding domain-containing protein [Brevundimonas sp.]|jgi:hypothetical protein|uniref:LytTR family DNA-binding domain-containing protein n=1 Tax=Brevundimonas sp. TaxID=1871086 RepID=UPI002E138FF6|nr:LytTR family DNA-binding domain-containing protein [Brevundimonas sp.]